jgi:predicted nucleic acid-binding protein
MPRRRIWQAGVLRRTGNSGLRVRHQGPCPLFFIGAHAVTQCVPLLTRDPGIYRTYFPELPLITPEDEHD